MIKLSRTAIEQHLKCPRCFHAERRLGVKPLGMVPLTLAVATDALLKREFDAVRASGARHPLWQREGLDVRACSHPDMDRWRNNRQGVRALRGGAEVYGAVDDVWVNNATGELHVVDYKSTSKQGTPDIDSGFGAAYKRQVEIYQWLLRREGHRVADVAYFLYVNGSKATAFYDADLVGHMRFDTTLIAHTGSDAWVEAAIDAAIACHQADAVPAGAADCDLCRYIRAREAAGAR